MQANWAIFSAADNADMVGHMMPYPVTLINKGGIVLEPRLPEVPDFPGTSLAGKATNLPNVLTT